MEYGCGHESNIKADIQGSFLPDWRRKQLLTDLLCNVPVPIADLVHDG